MDVGGGVRVVSRLLSSAEMCPLPQLPGESCDNFNGNILLIPVNVNSFGDKVDFYFKRSKV